MLNYILKEVSDLSFLLQSNNKFEIEVSSGQFARIAKGITSVDPSPNEELAQDRYMDGDGLGETDVIGGQLTLAFSGHRYYGDEAQDFIFSKLLEFGAERRVNFRWTLPDGSSFEGPATIANITGPSGDAGAKGEISFEIHFNGKPEYTPPQGTGV